MKTFLEFNDIEISPRKFKLKVRYPKTIFKNKEAIDKDDIIKILNGCSNLRLKTYVMLLASTWSKSHRSLINSYCDLNLELNPAKLCLWFQFIR